MWRNYFLSLAKRRIPWYNAEQETVDVLVMPLIRLQRFVHNSYDLGERLNGIQEVSGSIPLISTTQDETS